MPKQGEIDLLSDPIAQELLRSRIPARLAYVWLDGSPRVVPIWFHWTGQEFVMGSPPKAPKLKALRLNPKVALTIDDNTFPHKVLMVRGTASIKMVEGMVPEYELAAQRFWRSPRPGVDRAVTWHDFSNGAYFYPTRMGGGAGFPIAVSQRTVGVIRLP